jgi:protein-S-isoprenylcysteine O-methyltransferase Ste14
MNKAQFKFVFAPLGVAMGITLFIWFSIMAANALHIRSMRHLLPFIPASILIGLGILLLVLFLPIFFAGIHNLNRRGAVGQSSTLRTNGIYHYTRNPMYAGISMILCGTGLILLKPGVLAGGLIWFLITFLQCKREEPELMQRFKNEYVNYKKKTPMFFPDFGLMIRDLVIRPKVRPGRMRGRVR